jgi:hypothetical protein
MYTVLRLRQIVELSGLHVLFVILLCLVQPPYVTICMFLILSLCNLYVRLESCREA